MSPLHNFIQLSLNSVSAQVQILLAAFQRFANVRIYDNGERLSSVNHTRKIHHDRHHHHHHHQFITIKTSLIVSCYVFVVYLSLSFELIKQRCTFISFLFGLARSGSPQVVFSSQIFHSKN